MAAAESSVKNKAIEDISWLDAEKEYALGVHRGKLVCRNPKGKKLSAVPKWLKETELAEQLLALCEWLADHEMECQHRIETWMLRSLPVPLTFSEGLLMASQIYAKRQVEKEESDDR